MQQGKVNREFVSLFWDLFRYVDWQDEDLVEVRKIAHDGTWQESTAFQPALCPNPDILLAQKCEKAAGKIGYFMCPAKLNDQRANDNSVKELVCISVDIDRGDTDKALKDMCAQFGKPTLVVHSGGYTETNHKKIHVHYRLNEPEKDVKKVAMIREAMALVVGGDISFKRVPQVIRIPGTIYDKNTNETMVSVLESNPDAEVDISDIYDKLEPKIKELQSAELSISEALSRKNPEQNSERFKEISTEVIAEGGTETDNRFNRFSEYAGRWVAHARSGDCTPEEALTYVQNWNSENMSPPWPVERVAKEFNAILRVDRNNHSDQWNKSGQQDPIQPKDEDGQAKDWSWFDFSANKLFVGKPDPIPFIVDEMIVEGSVHALVADGGIGKTYVAMELGLRAAIGPKPGNKMYGFDVMKECITFLITVEDGRDDLHRRMYNIDRGGSLLKQAEDRFIVLPVTEEVYGGLTLVERDQKGNYDVSNAWKILTDKMEEVREKYPAHPFLIIMDTYSATHHGDENSSAGTNEWFRAASIVKNKYNAAVFVTHHIRKTSNEPINTPEEMRQHIRGSIAFVNNCRIVFGLWNMPGSRSLSKEAAGDEEEQSSMKFLNFAPVKTNIGIDWSNRTSKDHPDPIITLRRTGSGQPIFDESMHEKRITFKERQKEKQKKQQATTMAQVEAAIILSIKEHAKAGKPLNLSEIAKDKDITLPYPASEMNRKVIEDVLNKLIKEKTVLRKHMKVGRSKMYIHDTPDGPYALGQEDERSEEAVVIRWTDFEYNKDVNEYLPKQAEQK